MRVKDILMQAGLNSTSHGIPNILRARFNSLKMAWFLFILTSSTLCFYLIVKSMSNYFDYDVVTNTTLRNQIPAELPAITICNRNLFVTENARNYIINKLNISYIPSGILNDYIRYNAFNLSQEQKQSFGLSIKQFIYYCFFNQEECNYDNDFIWDYHLIYGNCFRFNSGNNSNGHSVSKKYIQRPGKDYGLKLKINTGDNDYFDEEDSRGLYITIHNSSIIPSYYGEGIFISSGLESNVAIKRLFINKKEKPYSDCVSDIEHYNSVLVEHVLNSGYGYRQSDCFVLCLQQYIIDKADCFMPGTNPLNCNKQCISIEDIDKMQGVIRTFFSEERVNKCYSDCPLECNSIEYNSFISYGYFPSDSYSYFLNSISDTKFNGTNFTQKLTTKNHIALNIFYDSYSYTTIEEVAKMDWIDLISNMGGTLGLFLGVSFLSFAELFEIIYLIAIYHLERRTKVEKIIEKK